MAASGITSPVRRADEAEARVRLVLPRVFHHLYRLLAVHGRNHKAVFKRAQRSELVDCFRFFRRAVRLGQHAVGDFHRHIANSQRTPVPAHRFLFAQGVAHFVFLTRAQQLGQVGHRNA